MRQLHYPYRMVCKKCGKNDVFEFDTVPLPKKGKLLTSHRPQSAPISTWPSSARIVELENGMRIHARSRSPTRSSHAVTGKVEIVAKPNTADYGMVFYPA